MQTGVFFSDVQHLTHVRYITDYTINGSFSVIFKFVPDISLQSESNRSLKRYAPAQPRLTPTITSTGGREIDCISPEGVLYAYGGLSTYKSTDFGATWTSISNPWGTGTIRKIKKLSNGEILVAGNNLDGLGGVQIWKTNASEASFTKKATLAATQESASAWGFEAYDKYICMPLINHSQD